MKTRNSFTAVLLLRLALGALLLSHAFLTLVALCVPQFATALAAQGMPTALAWPVMLIELAGGVLVLLGFPGRVAPLPMNRRVGGVISGNARNYERPRADS